MSERPSGLQDLRILVVEDESLVAMDLEAMLMGLGCEVIGPVGRLEEALRRAESEALDGALLDVNLRGTPVFPVADVLASRNIPFILSTGYGDDASFPEAHRSRPRLDKPFRLDLLETLLTRTFVAA